MRVPTSSIDFYSDDSIRYPYPIYDHLRALGPVVYLERHNLFALPDYKEVSEVLRQPHRFSSARGVSPLAKVNEILVGSTLNSDPPEHDRTRAITSEPLLPGALELIEGRVQRAAEGLIEELCKREEFDAVADFARFLPLTIVAELVGLPQTAGVDKMLKWASATFNLFGTENARTDAAFEDLKELRDFLLEYGRPEKLKEDGWAKRIFEVGPERGISFERCAQLMRDYINPSLDTTISVSGQIIKLFAENPEQWVLVRARPQLIPNAVEEAVRIAAPVRGWTRYVTEDSELAGYRIPKGSRVLVMFASACRDPKKYALPERFDVTRDVHDHVGFGQGVHMCLGMHLARLEIISLLRALRRRVERFELTGEPEIALNNSIRGFAKLPVRVHIAAAPLEGEMKRDAQAPWLEAVIANRREVATDIIELEFESASGVPFPPYQAGAHIDVFLKPGLVRQYSLTGDPGGQDRYRIGVLLDPRSRGGSTAVHAELHVGRKVRIGRPRNNFKLQHHAAHTILFAGGIGITPILSMAFALNSQAENWEMHFCARSEDRMAFREELTTFFPGKVNFHSDIGSREQQLDVASVLADPSPNKHLYVCGPNGFMDYVIKSAENLGWSTQCIHIERFGAEVNAEGATFSVVAAKSGKTVEVRPGETIADKLFAAGIGVSVSCQSGVCGTCLTPVVEGMPDHRDLVQTDLEKASNAYITICCSRSKTKRMVLDI